MKKLLVLLLPFFLALACSSAPDSRQSAWGPADSLSFAPSVPDAESAIPPQPMGGKTAFEYFSDERILAGWNLGNSLDAFNQYKRAYEGAWGNPVINQEIMNGVKAAGFDIVRIPVTWMGHIGRGPDHRISEAQLERVAEVADMAHKANLKAIINIHHDGWTPKLHNDEGWLSLGKAARSKLYAASDDYRTVTHQFARVWAQIAAYFKNHGDWLFFESMNEIHDGGWGWSADFRVDGPLQFEILNEWNQLFTDVVRASGGNNESRYLVIPSYCTIAECTYPGGSLESYANAGDLFKLPDDRAPGRQVVTFHYYKPDEVGLGANGGRTNWGAPEDRQRLDNDFRPFKGAYIDRGIPVLIGEIGAVRLLYPGDAAKEAQARESRRNYLAYAFETAKKYGLVPVYWDNGAAAGNGEKYGLFDRSTGQPNSEESRALLSAMINAAR